MPYASGMTDEVDFTMLTVGEVLKSVQKKLAILYMIRYNN